MAAIRAPDIATPTMIDTQTKASDLDSTMIVRSQDSITDGPGTNPGEPSTPKIPDSHQDAAAAILDHVRAAVLEHSDEATADGIVRAARRVITASPADEDHEGAEDARDVMADSLVPSRAYGRTPATDALLDGRADESEMNVPTESYLAKLGGLDAYRELRARGHAYRAAAARLAAALGPVPLPEGRDSVPGLGTPFHVPDRPVLTALAELMESAAFPAFMHSVEWLCPARWANVRLGFYSTVGNTRATSGGWQQHECELTGREFWLPVGAPCPAIVFDEVDPRGYVTGSESEHPEDRGPWSRTVHPALFAAGPEAVLAAVWDRIHALTRAAWEAFDEVGDWLTLTAEVRDGSDFGAADPGAAYRTRKGEGGGWLDTAPPR